MEELIADIDRDRDFTGERTGSGPTGGIIASTLDWIANAGFETFFRDVLDLNYITAHEFRQRYLVQALKRSAN